MRMKGAVIMRIWMLSSISLVTCCKLSQQNSPEVICLAADRAVFLVTSKNWSPKWTREIQLVQWSGNFVAGE